MSDPSQPSEVRRAAVGLAARSGFSETESGKLAIVVTEVATNLLKHGGGGHVLLRPLSSETGPTVEVFGIDSGPGMADVEQCLRDGHSTAGSSGTGLGAIRRLSIESEIYSVPDQGTVLRALCGGDSRRAPANNTTFDVGLVNVSYPGEDVSGDSVATREIGRTLQVLVADGLGHGFYAAEAAQTAVRAFEESAGMDTVTTMGRLHSALRPTRGAAASIAEIDSPAARLQYCGVGNISGVMIAPDKTSHCVSIPGIVGHQARSIRAFDYPWNQGSILILHSDGLSSRWSLQKYPGLATRSAGLIAAALFRDARRLNDDATIVVIKNRQP